jgi:hypothetical protein
VDPLESMLDFGEGIHPLPRGGTDLVAKRLLRRDQSVLQLVGWRWEAFSVRRDLISVA